MGRRGVPRAWLKSGSRGVRVAGTQGERDAEGEWVKEHGARALELAVTLGWCGTCGEHVNEAEGKLHDRWCVVPLPRRYLRTEAGEVMPTPKISEPTVKPKLEQGPQAVMWGAVFQALIGAHVAPQSWTSADLDACEKLADAAVERFNARVETVSERDDRVESETRVYRERRKRERIAAENGDASEAEDPG